MRRGRVEHLVLTFVATLCRSGATQRTVADGDAWTRALRQRTFRAHLEGFCCCIEDLAPSDCDCSTEPSAALVARISTCRQTGPAAY